MPSDRDEGREEEEGEGERREELIARVQRHFYDNEEFAKKVEDWIDENSACIDLEQEEMSLQYTDLYNGYQRLVEGELEDFIAEQGSSVQHFYSLIVAATDEDPLSSAAIFGQILTACCDFDVFMQMMTESKKKQVEDDLDCGDECKQTQQPNSQRK
jgi:hypothetical protein